MILFTVSCVASPAPDVYALLEANANLPAMRLGIAKVISDDLHPRGRGIALAYRSDDDPAVRALSYVWLLRAGGGDGVDWLSQGLRDPALHVRAICLVYADHVRDWTTDTWTAMWDIAETCELGHVFDRATTRLVQRGGRDAARRVHAIVQERGAGWGPYAVRALALCPEERFRDVFEASMASSNEEHALLGKRAIEALDGVRPLDAVPPEAWTTREFHDHWRSDRYREEIPEQVPVDAFLRRLQRERVVVLGELHSWLPLRAAQITILSELHAAHGKRLVLVCEKPVEEYQAPLIQAASLWGVETTFLEDDVLGSTGSPAERDVIVRRRLVARVLEQPTRVFLVCYGESHRRSFQVALEEAGIPCASIALYGFHGMLGAAMRSRGGRLSGFAFRYSDNSYFLPSGSYATRLGCAGLDEVFGDALGG